MITFQAHNVPDAFRGKHVLCTWLMEVAKAERRKITELNFVLMTDRALLRYNRQYLRHDFLTDVITFDSSSEDGTISGDVLMSYDRIRENARTFGVTTRQELHRVMVHGLLHLCGRSDKSATQRAAMKRAEDRHLQRLPEGS